MRYYKKLIFFLIIFISTISFVKSSEQIVYLNLDNVISGTKSGKLVIENLKESRTVALAKFEKKEKELKIIEEDINKQKNILSQEELTKKISDFRKDVSSFRNEREKLVNSFNKKKVIEFDKFFKKIVPIIESYVKEKNIDIVLDKKNIFLANKNRDITNEIIKVIDAKIK